MMALLRFDVKNTFQQGGLQGVMGAKAAMWCWRLMRIFRPCSTSSTNACLRLITVAAVGRISALEPQGVIWL